MKKAIYLLIAAITMPLLGHALNVESIKLGGHIGKRIDDCIANITKKADTEYLIEPFRHREERKYWQTEFIGKWMLGAVAGYEYSHDKELYDMIASAAKSLMATQTPDGYIGNYSNDARLTNWDIWGRKYTSLGLMAYYRISGDKSALDAVCRLIDHLLVEIEQKNADIAGTGLYYGMASCSILEPVVYLYKYTNNPAYLDFAKSIINSIEKDGHAQLIAKALADVPVWNRSAHDPKWWVFANGQKAYEMMSCYKGMLELGEVTADPIYLEAAEHTAASIRNDEINITGSGASLECWYNGKIYQTLPARRTMETCVTFTYIQFCQRLWELTGSNVYVDELERTIYNAMLGALKDDGSIMTQYSPLEGYHATGERHCNMDINCCEANGPRGFAMIPKVALTTRNDAVVVNLYTPIEATIALDKKNKVNIKVDANVPVSGKATVSVNPAKAAAFKLALRIPSWADNAVASVNGEPVEVMHRGGYIYLNRTWRASDVVELNFGISTKVVRQNNCQAIVRGPMVFARDARFGDGDVDETLAIETKNGVVDAIINEQPSTPFAWITIEVPVERGTYGEATKDSGPKTVKMCDFSSAGNDWKMSSRYRVWLPRTFNVMLPPAER